MKWMVPQVTSQQRDWSAAVTILEQHQHGQRQIHRL